MSELHTAQLQNWQERMRAGDAAARDELVRAIIERMERLARKMLKNFPNVKRWAQTDDVMQSALMRLLRSLEKVQPGSVREFFGLAALEMRRELLDLARHFYGPEGQGAHHASQVMHPEQSTPAFDPPAPSAADTDLDKWSAFHHEVEKLPAEEREVVGLMFYHGMSSTEVAALFQVSDRTIRRWWNAALLKLHKHMQEPGFND